MKLSTMLLIGVIAAAGAAQAQDQGTPPAQGGGGRNGALRQACADDIKNMCADKQGREVLACLRTNNDKLSAGCQDAVSKARPPQTPPAPQN